MSTGNPDGAPASPLPVPNELIERLKGHVPKLEEIETSAGKFYMRKRTGADRWRMIVVQEQIGRHGGKSFPPAMIVALSLMNPDGTPLFEKVEEGFDFCSSLDDGILTELYNEALRITGLGKHAVEEAEKKSSSSQSSDSGTTSPSS